METINVFVMNPEMSAGQKIGLVISFAIAFVIFLAFYKLGAPRK